MGELKWGMSMDSRGFKQGLDEAVRGVRNAKNEIEQSGQSMANAFDGLKNAAKGIGLALGLNELKNLAVGIAKTRGEFQDLETAFKTMLGSADKANALMAQLTKTAATTPFGLQEVAGGAKQLLAYGIEAEKVNDTLIRLGDIAAGLSIPLNDLVYLYGTTMVQGKLFTQDLKQFQGRGIPIADELAKQFGIAKSQVAEFVTAGKVGAEAVEQAIINMTSEGGKFGGLMEAISKNILGQWSNIEDQIDMMFNSIGEENQDAINAVLDSISESIKFLSDNYKTIGISIAGVVASYGVWKATLVGHNALLGAQTAGEQKRLEVVTNAYQLEIEKLKEINALREGGQAKAVSVDTSDIKTAVDSGAITQEQGDELAKLREMTAEKKLLAEAELVNANALVKEKQAALESASAMAEAALEQQEFYQSKLDGIDAQIQSSEKAGNAEELLSLNKERNIVATQLETVATEANTQGTKVATASKELDIAVARQHVAAKNLSTATQNANTAATIQNTSAQTTNTTATKLGTLAQKAWSVAVGLGSKAFNALKVAIMSNPIGAIAVVITSVVTAVSAWTSKQKELNKAVEEGAEKSKEFHNAIKQENSQIENHVNTIRDSKAAKIDQIKAYSELMELVPELTKEYSRQELAALSATQAEKLLTEALREREMQQLKKGRDTAQSTLQSLEGGVSDWASLAPEQRKFLKEDFALDADSFNADKAIAQLRGYIVEADKTIFKTSEMNKVFELTGMEKGAEKTKKMTKALGDLSQKEKDLRRIEQLMTSAQDWSGGLAKKAENKARKELGIDFGVTPELTNRINKYTDEFKAQYLKNREELIALTNKYGISIDELMLQSQGSHSAQKDLTPLFNEKFRPILDSYLEAKTHIEQEIQADSGIKTEIEIIADMSDDELEQALINATKSLADAENQLEELTKDGINSDVSFGLNADTTPAENAVDTAKTNVNNYLLNNFSTLPQVEASTTVGATVNLDIKKGAVTGGTGLNPAIFGFQSWWDSLTGGSFTTDLVSTPYASREQQVATLKATIEAQKKTIQNLTNQLKSRKSPAKATSNTDKKKGTSKKSTDKKSTVKTPTAKEIADANNDVIETEKENAKEREEVISDLENEIAQLRIDVEKQGSEAYIEQLKLDRKKEEEELKKRKEDAIKQEKERQKAEFEANQKAKKTKNPKYKEQAWDEKNLNYDTINQINSLYDDVIALSTKKYDKEIFEKSIQLRLDYLKEYGSLLQKELSLQEDYDNQITNASNEWDRKRLEREKSQKISKVKFEDISMGIDWGALYGGVANLSTSMLEKMNEQLRAYAQTDAFKQADSQTQQDVIALIDEIRKFVGSDVSVTWQTLADATTEFSKAVATYDTAKKAEEKYKTETYLPQKEKLKKGQITEEQFKPIQEQFDKLGEATASAKESVQSFGVMLNNTATELQNYTSKLTTALSKAKGWEGVEGFSELKNAIGEMDSFKGSLDTSIATMQEGQTKEFAKSISSSLGKGLDLFGGKIEGVLSSSLGTMVGSIAQIPNMILGIADTIKNLVGGILDSFSDLLKFEWLSDLFVTIADAISNLITAIFDLPENIYNALESIVLSIGNVFDTLIGRIGNILSFGALSSEGMSEWFLNSNAEEVKEAIDNLTKRNELLATSVDNLTDAMKKFGGADSLKYYEEAYKTQEEINDNYKAIAKEQSSYHKAHKSWRYYWGGFSDEELLKVSGLIGRSWSGDIFDLSPEELKVLLGLPDLVEKIRDTGEGDYGERFLQTLYDWADQAGKLDEITNNLKEALTGVSFDSFYDSFTSMLMDMEITAEEAGENISETFMQAMISSLVAEKYRKKLEQWYEKYAEYAKDGLAQDEIADLRSDYVNNIVKPALEERDALAELTGYGSSSSSSSATNRGIESMTQEEAQELTGRFTALQIAGEAIRNQATATNGLLQAFMGQIAPSISATEESNSTLKELRELAIQRNGYLSDISDYSKNLIAIKNTLTKIETNTQNL